MKMFNCNCNVFLIQIHFFLNHSPENHGRKMQLPYTFTHKSTPQFKGKTCIMTSFHSIILPPHSILWLYKVKVLIPNMFSSWTRGVNLYASTHGTCKIKSYSGKKTFIGFDYVINFENHLSLYSVTQLLQVYCGRLSI